MASIQFWSATARRHTVFGFTLALVLLATSAIDVQAQESGPVRSFATDAGMILNPIKPEATADFEMVLGKVKEALNKSEAPGRKDQARGWKVFKAQEPGPNSSVLYVFVMDPAVDGGEYAVGQLLAEVFPTEAQALYDTFSGAYSGGQTLLNLNPVMDFGAP